LCSWRNTLPAFDGDIDVQLDGSVLTLVRRGVHDPTASAKAVVDLATGRTTLSWQGPSGSATTSDLLTDPPQA
jgi:sucrose phosphorylase